MTGKKSVNIHIEEQFQAYLHGVLNYLLPKKKKGAENIVDGPLNIYWFSSVIRKTNRMIIGKTEMQKCTLIGLH